MKRAVLGFLALAAGCGEKPREYRCGSEFVDACAETEALRLELKRIIDDPDASSRDVCRIVDSITEEVFAIFQNTAWSKSDPPHADLDGDAYPDPLNPRFSKVFVPAEDPRYEQIAGMQCRSYHHPAFPEEREGTCFLNSGRTGLVPEIAIGADTKWHLCPSEGIDATICPPGVSPVDFDYFETDCVAARLSSPYCEGTAQAWISNGTETVGALTTARTVIHDCPGISQESVEDKIRQRLDFVAGKLEE